MDLTPTFNRGFGFLGQSQGQGQGQFPFPFHVESMFDPSDFFIAERRDDDSQRLGFRAKMDWTETPEAHVLKADLPGLKKEEIKVEVLDGNTLSISGERRVEKRNETDSWRYVERSSGKFRRQFGLPRNSKVEELSAKVEDGVLTVTVPISKQDEARVKTIDIA